ncbi:MAG: serine/threonine protein kinase [Sandaracinus sp.]|nr:serine/threonine protein kinase [Sandaracinus sp.]MCB9625362.1 serine/threonine protein kinase [Sandaracinus sp.]
MRVSLEAWARTDRKLGFRWVALLTAGIVALLFGGFWGVVGGAMTQMAESAPDRRAGFTCALAGGAVPFLIGLLLVAQALRTHRRLTRLRNLAAFARQHGEVVSEAVASALSLSRHAAELLVLDAASLGVLVEDLPATSGVMPTAQNLAFAATQIGAPTGTLPLGLVLAGTWRVEGFLGAGGMGHVYDVTHVRTGRRYALKTLLPDARLSADSLRRFEREARAASALGHPGLVAVHDFDRHAGVDFLVMDRLEGETLDERLRREGTLPWETARGIARELADALDAAHAAGLLHRDVKPGNVFLARDGRGERAVLLDFGLAKPIDDATTSRITATGAAVGTPLYMSPEQARGEALDVRTDVYGLAATLYEMITGAPPFLEPTVARAYHRLLSEPALPASRLAPQPVPPELDALLVAALAKDPDARPADARRFAEALASVAA